MGAMIIGCGACDKINMSRKVMRTWFLSPTYMPFERESFFFFFWVQLSLWSSICGFCVKVVLKFFNCVNLVFNLSSLCY